MTVQEILSRKDTTDVLSTGPRATVSSAIATLVDRNIGSLVVVDDDGGVVGIITERDVLRRCAHEIETVGDTPVEEIMTRSVIVGQVTDTVDYVMSVMTENRIRHLPIVSDAGLVGMVSIGDVVQSQLRETKHERRHMKRYIQGTY